MVVFGDRNGQRRTLVLPVGNELVERFGVDHRARKDMRPDLAALFEDADGKLSASGAGELLQADRGAQAGWAGADDHNVISHGFALAHPLLLTAGSRRLVARA